MTTSTRMNNFKRMAERLSKQGKLLTSVDKSSIKALPLENGAGENNLSLYRLQTHMLRLVLNPCRKAVSH
jgi:hypothetical protein